MELRLVDRKFSREFSFPFKNESKRTKGFGFVKDKTLINYDEVDMEHVVAVPDEIMSRWEQEAGMCYFIVVDAESNKGTTYAWDEKEFNAFVVNDNGKIVDKISS